jgi:hypothetical protein
LSENPSRIGPDSNSVVFALIFDATSQANDKGFDEPRIVGYGRDWWIYPAQPKHR